MLPILGLAVLFALLSKVSNAWVAPELLLGAALGAGALAGHCVLRRGGFDHRRMRGEAASLSAQVDFARSLLLAGDADQVNHLARQHLVATGSSGLEPGRHHSDRQIERHHRSLEMIALALAATRKLAAAESRATSDSLTGLANRQGVNDALDRMFAQASRSIEPMALLVLDLDHFKAINDNFGHPAGDRVLAAVGATMRSALRSSDFAGRSGGEEFAVLLANTELSGAMITAEKIRRAVADIRIAGADVAITVSIGVAIYPTHALSTSELDSLADVALYDAKRAGRNQIGVATEPAEPALIPIASLEG